MVATTENNKSSVQEAISAVPTNYVEKTGSDNPFDSVDISTSSFDYSTPVLADMDNDGDLDLVVGGYDHDDLYYFENQGSATNPSFVQQTGSDNPFSNVQITQPTFASSIFASPSLGDVDADGDLDLIIGDSNNRNIVYYENEGSASAANYVLKTGNDNPFDGISVPSYGGAPALVDMDDDGDADLVVGDGYGDARYFQNVRSNGQANYTERTGSNNPFNNVYVGYGYGYAAPVFADIDSDGDLDALFSDSSGSVRFFEKRDSGYVAIASNSSPVNNVRATTYNSAVAVGDIDGDGDLDIAVGGKEGTISFFEDSRTKPVLTSFENESAFEVTSLGLTNTLIFEIDKISNLSEILVFRVDDAEGNNPEQVASFSALKSGLLPDSYEPTMTLESDLVDTGQFFQVQVVVDGMTRSATPTSLGDGRLSLDFGSGIVLMVQQAAEGVSNMMMGDADGIDLGDSGNPMMLEFNVYREADYNNTVGLYTTDTADGGILVENSANDDNRVAERALITDGPKVDEVTGTMLMPGDEGYKEAAMARRLDVSLTGENGMVQSFTAELSGDYQYLASFLIADGSDMSSDEIYFSHVGANSNGNDHAKYLGNNTFGYEDMAGLGDRDYNDIVVQFTATAQQKVGLD